MASLDPQQTMEALKDKAIQAISGYFPFEGRRHRLVLNNIYPAETRLLARNVGDQKRAKLGNRTWSTPIYGDLSVMDKSSGRVLSAAKKVRLANVPNITQRYSYIVNGTEYQMSNQWRLKSGVYTRIKDNGELEATFNLAKGNGFDIGFDPKNYRFTFQQGTANIPLYSVLKGLGVTETRMRDRWNDEIFEANKNWADYENDLKRYIKSSTGRAPDSLQSAVSTLRETMDETALLPETTRITLGKPFNKVDGDAIMRASSKVLGVSRGTSKPDHRDALEYKDLLSVDDLVAERVEKNQRRIRDKVSNNLDRKSLVRDIISADIFNQPIRDLFTSTAIKETPKMMNPISMAGGQLKTTPMGPGGISSPHKVSVAAKVVHPSQIGFIDPIQTPEGEKTGISLQLVIGVRKRGRTPVIQMYDLKKGKMVGVTPQEAVQKTVALPDQYTWGRKRPVPVAKVIKASTKGNDLREVPSDEVDYVLPSSKRLFTVATNMIPFLQNNQGARAMYAAHHIEQAISLKDPEKPLIQVSVGGDNPNQTFERVFGMTSAHRAPTSGMVTKVTDDEIHIRGKDGKVSKVQIYNHYPLNHSPGSFLHARPVVKVGDQVKREDLVADTNFTKDGVLSMGTNLRTAYAPYRGYTFEDGITISESASKKLTSEHMRGKVLALGKEVYLGKSKYRANYPDRLTDAQANKLDADGIVKPGTDVGPGDYLIAALRRSDPTKESLLLRALHKNLPRDYTDHSLVWDGPKGVVQDVVRRNKDVLIYVKTEEPAQVGDKLSGRHGNKGVITRIVADDQMPYVKEDGEKKPVEIMLAPEGVPGRINLGQIYETALGKVAAKKGETMAVSNFETDSSRRIVKVKEHMRRIKTKEGPRLVKVRAHERQLSYHELVEKALKDAGVSERQELIDPVTGNALKDDKDRDPLVGTQYILKLEHQAAKHKHARAHGWGFDYDVNLVPKGGGPGGAQSLGALGLYALLAHGATDNIREMYSYKSDRSQDDVWTALQAGEALPPPKPTFAFRKFEAYMNMMGLNLDKKGNSLTLIPFTDEQILAMSNGKLTRPGRTLLSKNLKPEKGGLFDEDITGGIGGSQWSHFPLAEEMPNPMFERAIQSVLDMKKKEYEDIIRGNKGLDENGEIVPADEAEVSGGKAISMMLAGINRDELLEQAEEQIPSAKGSKLNALNRRIKILRALKSAGLTPSVYIMKNVPVLPPQFRSVAVLPSGDLNEDDLTGLYKDLSLSNSQLSLLPKELPDEERNPLRIELYDGLKALYGLGASPRRSQAKGVLAQVTPTKEGYIHARLMRRKQDLTGRAVIVPEESLGLDEVGLPRWMARNIFRPFVVRELTQMGYKPLEALDAVRNEDEVAEVALDKVSKERPVLLKRDPVLHKFGVMAFKPKLIAGDTIQIHPLVTGGFNADFDGDTMSVYVPVTNQAVEESYSMLPSRNLFSPATGAVMYTPTGGALIGLFQISDWGKASGKRFKDRDGAIAAARDGKVGFTDVVFVGKKRTTPGRLILDRGLPKEMQGGPLLTDSKYRLDKKAVRDLLVQTAVEHDKKFGDVAQHLKDVGFAYAYRTGSSLDLADLRPLMKIRDAAVAKAEAAISKARKAGMKGEVLDKKIIEAYQRATKEMSAEAQKHLAKTDNRLLAMGVTGKPGWGQIQQMILAPMLFADINKSIIPTPVRKSYAEGLDASDYILAAASARETIMDKVLQVRGPGALSKEIVNTVTNLTVSEKDCGTDRGITLPLDDRNVLDRYLAAPVKVRRRTFPAGTLVTPEVVDSIRSGSKTKRILVRSPLKCRAADGMCQKCYGLDEFGRDPNIGRNVGVLAAQSIGERATQLTMRTFHTGGLADKKTGVLSSFDRLNQILRLPEIVPGSATLSRAKGVISKIEESPAGGWDVTVSGEKHYVPLDRGLLPTTKVGSRVKRGQSLSGGVINPRELLPLTSISDTQNYLSDELHGIFKEENIKRRHAEVIVKALTNLSRVEDPGGHDTLLKGDLVPTSTIKAWNRGHPGETVKIAPLLKGVKTMPLGMQEDWIARLQHQQLKDTLIEAASKGWVSDIHSTHPAPGLVYSAEFGVRPEDKPYAY